MKPILTLFAAAFLCGCGFFGDRVEQFDDLLAKERAKIQELATLNEVLSNERDDALARTEDLAEASKRSSERVEELARELERALVGAEPGNVEAIRAAYEEQLEVARQARDKARAAADNARRVDVSATRTKRELAEAREMLEEYKAQRDRALDGKEAEDDATRAWVAAIIAMAGGALKLFGKAAA